MFETGFGISEIALVCVVALVVLGPVKMLGAVRTLGQWWGRLQGFVSQAKAELSSQMDASEFSDLKKDLQETAQAFKSNMEEAGESLRKQVEDASGGLEEKAKEIGEDFQKELDSAAASANSRSGMESAFDAAASETTMTADGVEVASDVPPELEHSTVFEKRYRPGRSWDDLTEQLSRMEERLGRSAGPVLRKCSKYAPRARVARCRIYR